MITMFDKINLFSKIIKLKKERELWDSYAQLRKSFEKQEKETREKEESTAEKYRERMVANSRKEREKRLSIAKTSLDRGVLRKEKEIFDDFMFVLERKLEDFTKEPGYKDYLGRLLEKMKAECNATEIVCNPRDAEIIRGFDSSLAVSESELVLGGLIAVDGQSGVRYNRSFNSRLENFRGEIGAEIVGLLEGDKVE